MILTNPPFGTKGANQAPTPDDFDVLPTLEGAGGWGKANTVFGGRLEELIRELNQAIAA